jgi:hypothetical protein
MKRKMTIIGILGMLFSLLAVANVGAESDQPCTANADFGEDAKQDFDTEGATGILAVKDQNGVTRYVNVVISGDAVTFTSLATSLTDPTPPTGLALTSVTFCVKGGPVNTGQITDSEAPFTGTAPFNPNSGMNYDVSHTVVYSINVREDVAYLGEWCSPGYWRQPQHLDSWAATDYDPSDAFSTALGYSVTRSKPGRDNNAPTDPTLLYVLQNPQFYSGADFNAVGDLLSGAHPDVDFQGTRVEDSCPLS